MRCLRGRDYIVINRYAGQRPIFDVTKGTKQMGGAIVGWCVDGEYYEHGSTFVPPADGGPCYAQAVQDLEVPKACLPGVNLTRLGIR